jgi:hypothetical protein
MTAAQKTACSKFGHPFDQDNTYEFMDGFGVWHRRCRACHRLAMRRYRANQRKGQANGQSR